MHNAIEAEVVRRSGERKRISEIYRSVRRRVKGSCPSGRTEADLHKPEWDALYPQSGGEAKYYVYAHVHPDLCCMEVKDEAGLFVGYRIDGVPFYIGKGCGDRAYDLSRNEGHGVELRGLKKAGVRPNDIVKIIAENLTESEALKLESKLIYFFGTRYEKGIDGLLVNLDIPRRPEILNIPRIAERNSSELARK